MAQELPKAEYQNPYETLGEKPPSTAQDTAIELYNLQNQKDELEAQVSALSKKIDWIRYIHLPNKFEEEGIEKVRYEGIGLVYLKGGLRASIPADKKEAAWEWLSDHGHGALITKTVNAQSLSSAMSKRLKDGQEIPEELIRCYLFTQAVITK